MRVHSFATRVQLAGISARNRDVGTIEGNSTADARVGIPATPWSVKTNTIVSSVLDDFIRKLRVNLDKNMEFNQAVMEIILPSLYQSKPVRFEGNNYDKEWETEAEKRKLPNKKNTPQALKDDLEPKNMEILSKYGILNHREIKARYHIEVENYSKTINIEAETAITMAKKPTTAP